MTNVVTYYSEAVSTDDGFFRVASQVVPVGEAYTGPVNPALLDTREEVLLNFGALQPNTIMDIFRESDTF